MNNKCCGEQCSHKKVKRLEEKSFNQRVYEIVRQIPYGKVTNYGTIAKIMGRPRASRLVGFALHANPSNSLTPCHRVVMKNGGLSSGFKFGGMEVHKMFLSREGVEISDEYRVDMEKYGYFFDK